MGQTLRSGSRGSRILGLTERRVLSQQSLTSSVPILVHQRSRVLSRLTHLDDLLQLALADLRTRQDQSPPLGNLLRLLLLLNEGILGRNEMRHRFSIFILLLLLLLLSSIVFLNILQSFRALELSEILSDGRFVDFGVLFGRIVESWSGLFLKGNICHVVYRIRSSAVCPSDTVEDDSVPISLVFFGFARILFQEVSRCDAKENANRLTGYQQP